MDDPLLCSLREDVRGLLVWIRTFTLEPWKCTEADVKRLRELGWSDAAIHDAAQVASYFNYINRVADGLGIDPEPGLPHWGHRRKSR